MIGAAFILVGAIASVVSWQWLLSKERRLAYVAELEHRYEYSPLPRFLRTRPPRTRFEWFGMWAAAVTAGLVSPFIFVVGVAILARELS